MSARSLCSSNQQDFSDLPQVPPLAWACLAIGLGLSALLSWGVHREIGNDARLYFSNASDQMTQTIEERLETFGLVLRSGAGLISGSDNVTRSDWRRYVEQLQPQLNLPGVQGIGFSELLQPQDLASHVERVRAEGFPEYSVNPEGQRDIYSAIVYLEPFSGRNLAAFGYDMYSEQVRRAAMDQARDSGLPTLSGSVQLVQETTSEIQPGILMYFPVYRPHLSPTTLQERRENLLGWTYSPYRMRDLMSSILQKWQPQLARDLDLYIYDGTTADASNLLYRSRAEAVYVPSATHGLPSHQHRTIDFNGRSWLLVYDFDPAAANLSYLPTWYVFGGGSLITLLLFGLLLSQRNTRQRAEHIAAGLTSDILARDALLQESEFRWKYALEGAGDGLWDWHLSSNETYWTPQLKAMMGFADHEIAGRLDDWKQRIHPDDLTRVMTEVSDYLEGRSTEYSSEHRVQCKDGHYLWILDRGSIVQRDHAGKPLRMIGTHTDISVRKQGELHLRETLATLQRLQQALDQLDICVYIKDRDSRYVYANQHTLKQLGFTLDELKGKTDSSFFPAETARHLLETDRRALAGESTVEEVAMGSGSTRRVYLEMKTPLLGSGDTQEITGLCGISTDITARKQLEASLQQRQHELEEAQRIGMMGSFSMDLASGTVVWSDQLFAMFGLSPGSAPPSFADHGKMFAQESWAQLQMVVARTCEQGTPYEVELETLTADGIRGWMLARGEALRDADYKVTGLRGIAQDITLRKRADQRIEQLTNFYVALSSCNKLLTNCRTDAEIYQQICDIIVMHSGMQMAWIGLVDKSGQRVVPAYWAGTGIEYLDDIVVTTNPDDPHGQGATGTAARENHPVWVDNFRYNPISAPWQQRGLQFGWSCSAALPIVRGGKPIGAVTFYSTKRGTYDQDIRRLMEEMGHVISFALDKLDAEALAYQGSAVLEKVFLQTVGLATNLVELRDPYTAGHVRRVSQLAEAIGRQLGWDDTRVQGLRVAGLLYDIGKILVPAEILSKPGTLTAMEHQLIRQHPQAGFDLLQHMDFPWPVAQVALQHHERLDGSGYPQGLKGEGILQESRIIGLADVVLAMCSHRPYRAALPLESALTEIENGKETQYDAVVVDACLRLFREQGYTL